MWTLIDANTGPPVGAPAGGLTVNLTVSDATNGGDFLASASEGAKTVTFKEGESVVTYSVPTVDDNQDEPNGNNRIGIVAGNGYTVGNALVVSTPTVRDNDTPVPNLSVTPGLRQRRQAQCVVERADRRHFLRIQCPGKTRSQTYLRGSRTAPRLSWPRQRAIRSPA